MLLKVRRQFSYWFLYVILTPLYWSFLAIRWVLRLTLRSIRWAARIPLFPFHLIRTCLSLLGQSLAVRRAADRFVNRFRADNNFRLRVFWALGLAHLVFNLVVFGFGPAIEFPVSETVQRYRNLQFHGEFVTDRELQWLPWVGELFAWTWGSLRWISWTLWVVMLIVNLVYIPIAFRDEMSRAWRFGVRSVREKRGSVAAPTAGAPAAATPSAGIQAGLMAAGFKESFNFLREVLGATVANLFTHPQIRR
ncbi:MAG: hypothetical protein HY473_00315 [Candidatus Sungbacteria bacterium]|uniref:Uncharacterized protein n=1 Tax=Candidatus Sungiibacteriota bacterium TaxID=2750080 RepID=A0A932YYW7_9BACT|nr:hypothetical protein [Candidatus Sungbacteria bacterium]